MANVVSWFEIPVTDMDRASAFYRTVLSTDLQRADMGGDPYAFFSASQESVGGALVQSAQHVPSNKEGTIVYLNGGEDLTAPLSRVESAGGRVLLPKTLISEGMGYFAFFQDTEGNKVGLFSMH